MALSEQQPQIDQVGCLSSAGEPDFKLLARYSAMLPSGLPAWFTV